MLTRLRKSLARLLGAMAYPFIALGVPPNYMTVSSLILCSLAAWLIAEGRLFYAFFPFALGSLLDALDGTVARAEGKTTKFGAFLDSSLDRYSDGVVLSGFALLYTSPLFRLVVLTAMMGSFLVSYSRARAEAMGVKMEGIGIGERAERLILIAVGLAVPRVALSVLLILAIISNFTFLQRAHEAYLRLSA